MTERSSRTPVTVIIGGEEYKVRAAAPPEYTRACAAYVDQTLAEVSRPGSLIEGHKAAILAALSLTDQLFQARSENEALREALTRVASRLAEDIQAALEPADLASGR
ncbi:MAG TPA: cell division protein ZapA [Longimicrobiales bacterium]|nr:cell division protein ZapA [Longimicrobiales bacterium]